jgi:hypothetical protein
MWLVVRGIDRPAAFYESDAGCAIDLRKLTLTLRPSWNLVDNPEFDNKLIRFALRRRNLSLSITRVLVLQEIGQGLGLHSSERRPQSYSI